MKYSAQRPSCTEHSLCLCNQSMEQLVMASFINEINQIDLPFPLY